MPWIDENEAAKKNQTPEQYAENIASTWKQGLQKWGLDEKRIQKLRQSVEMVLYTPASQAGIPLSILNSFSAPSDELQQDSDALRDLILSTTSSLMGLIGLTADPIQSKEHILISKIIEQSWKAKKDLDLPKLIRDIQAPPFDKVGVLDLETFYPQKERAKFIVEAE